ncbi:pseudaminic acid cytidylyltransferase [Pedobacter changchengzhani]|uniref:Pseudaminic acid cytidylyltransferase n=1 Tax=Pedobacter changchengzhani TaxID=2529274 RepID=A0A4R5MPB6_9SPHI|nr:pseudaminic acid cytidylyltransferase [Pedobacter changchengzhani]TDG37697.1 pseudaminic acid cytidylyltransferase [Pedobacter changchengzhani]
MHKLAIIPARGGSKRIPRKNLKIFLGKPIIAYSIEVAVKSGLFDEVMVSTDDEEIAKIAIQYGAKVPFMRSSERSNDFATTYEVIEEVLLNYNKLGQTFNQACCIYPCAPFISVQSLKEASQKLTSFDTVFPVVKFGFPIQRALKKEESNKIAFLQPGFELYRSQDLDERYHDAGQFYWFNVDKALQNKSLLSANTGCVVLSEIEVQDIDNEIDWKLAELKYNLLNEIS